MKTPYRFRWLFPVLLLWSGCGNAQAEVARVDKLESEIEEKRKVRSGLEKEIAVAADLEAWILVSMPIQPLVVGIVRSMGPESTIVHLQLEREPDTPSQLFFRLVLNTDSERQLEQTLEVIRKMHFRESNQSYTRSNGELVYTARLTWQDPQSQNREMPEQVQKSSVTVPLMSQQKTEGVEQARAEEEELQIQLGLEQELLASLQQQSADLLNFVARWKPYFVLVEEQELAQTAIRMKVREEGINTLTQRYEQVPHKIADRDIASLPTLTRATLVIDDNYDKVLNWLGATEKTKPTLRVGKLDLAKGSRGGDVRLELTLEVPLLRRGS